MRAEGTPVPIPNTTVKIRAADGTMLETAWESRRLPDIFLQEKPCHRGGRPACLHAEADGAFDREAFRQYIVLQAMSGQERMFLCADGV